MGIAGYYGVDDAVAMWEREKSAYDGGTINELTCMPAATIYNSSGEPPEGSAVRK